MQKNSLDCLNLQENIESFDIDDLYKNILIYLEKLQ